MNSLVFYLSPEFLLNFLSNLYIPPWFGNIFKFEFKLLENLFVSQNLLTTDQTLPQVLFMTPSDREKFINTSSTWAVFLRKFIFPLGKKGGNSQTSDTPRVGFEPAQDLNSGFVE